MCLTWAGNSIVGTAASDDGVSAAITACCTNNKAHVPVMRAINFDIMVPFLCIEITNSENKIQSLCTAEECFGLSFLSSFSTPHGMTACIISNQYRQRMMIATNCIF